MPLARVTGATRKVVIGPDGSPQTAWDVFFVTKSGTRGSFTIIAEKLEPEEVRSRLEEEARAIEDVLNITIE